MERHFVFSALKSFKAHLNDISVFTWKKDDEINFCHCVFFRLEATRMTTDLQTLYLLYLNTPAPAVPCSYFFQKHAAATKFPASRCLTLAFPDPSLFQIGSFPMHACMHASFSFSFTSGLASVRSSACIHVDATTSIVQQYSTVIFTTARPYVK